MESIKKIMEQLPKKFSEQSTSISRLKDILSKGEISLYKGKLTTPAVVASVAKIKAAFPALPGSFYDTFTERIIDNEFCDERLTAAVNCVIDNCLYPTPTIAQFISFDRRVKFYTYEEMLKMSSENVDIWKNYAAIDLGLPKKVWCHINDIEKYDL
jgi:hypothetical protein